MGWDNDHTLLTAPISLGDVSYAAGLGGPPYDLGTMIKNGYFNPAAKYKPVVSPVIGILSAEQRAATRYGLVIPSAFAPINSMPPAWTYNQPTTGPFRILDFAKEDLSPFYGYDAKAVSPIALDLPYSLTLNDTNGILLWKDSGVNHYYSGVTNAEWHQDRSLTVSEILSGGGDSYYNDYIAFVVYDLNTYDTYPDSSSCIITTNKKFGDLNTVETFMLYPQGNGTDGGDYIDQNIHYPKIDLLKDTDRDGHKFRIAVCVCRTGPSSSSYAYQVLPSNYTCWSLAFDYRRRSDYVDSIGVLAGSINKLTGIINSGPTLTKVSDYDSTWEIWQINNLANNPVTGSVTTSSDWVASNLTTIIVDVDVPYGLIGTSPSTPGITGMQRLTYENIRYQNPNTTYTQDLITSSSGLGTIYIAKSAPKQISVRAMFKQNDGSNTKGFNNVLIISANS